MKILKIINTKTLLTFVAVIGAVGVLTWSPRVFADAAGDACKTQKSVDKRNACKDGFNKGYADPKKKQADICKKYNKKNKSACEAGVQKGKDKKDAGSGPGGTMSGLNGSGGYKDTCGQGNDAVKTKFNFGCQGSNYEGPGGSIGDLAFSFIRFLSMGVGIVVVISIIVAGIQYSASEGNPETTQSAKNRIRSAIIGLVLYVFIFAIIQFLVPGGLFK